MSQLILRVEAMPGTSIDAAAAQAIRLANHMRVTVMFSFNGVDCMACQGDDPEKLATEAMRLMGVKTSYKLARGKP